MVNNSPKDRVVGPLPNGHFMAYKCGLLTTGSNWDDPPSTCGCQNGRDHLPKGLQMKEKMLTK